MRSHAKTRDSVAPLLALLVGLWSCSDADLAGRILAVESESTVIGLVYLDQNGNEARDAEDEAVEGLEIRSWGTRSRCSTSTSPSSPSTPAIR